jgi:hypothetical protein
VAHLRITEVTLAAFSSHWSHCDCISSHWSHSDSIFQALKLQWLYIPVTGATVAAPLNHWYHNGSESLELQWLQLKITEITLAAFCSHWSHCGCIFQSLESQLLHFPVTGATVAALLNHWSHSSSNPWNCSGYN